tara:strand:- start:16134 stop:17516 length:1383 start_codon:yes stop_codon:yes gene_type:complete
MANYSAGINAFQPAVGSGGTGTATPGITKGQPFRTDITAATSGGVAGTNKLWLPIWSGEVMYAYDQYRVFEPFVESRTISSGRSMEFPIMGTVNLKPAWFAGEELIGSPNDHVSKTFAVSLDNRPIASFFELDNVDLMITQWQYRQELARQAGQTLANARDIQIAAYIARAGMESVIANDPRLSGGASDWNHSLKDGPIYSSGFSTKLEYLSGNGADATDANRADGALALLAAIEDFMIHLQEINADTSGVYCAVPPQTFHDIRALGVARDTGDLGGGAGRPFFGGVADAGGLGAGLRDGMMALQDSLEYMSCRIIKTNHLPQWNAYTTGTGGSAGDTDIYGDYNIGEPRYNLDFTLSKNAGSGAAKANGATASAGIKALLWQSKSVASLSLQGMKVDTVEDVRRNTNFTVASMMAGTGVLRPECAAIVCGGYQNGGTTGLTRAKALEYSMMTAEYTNTA